MMRNSNIKLSYTRAREIKREPLSSIGINMNNYGLHNISYRYVDTKSMEGEEGDLDVDRKARGGASLRRGTERGVTFKSHSKNKRRIIVPSNTPAHVYLFLFNIFFVHS
jgi:hypothetical protein